MAKKWHLAILRKGVEAWNRYRVVEHPSGSISYQRADLQEANLRGTNLRGAILRNADLQGADLQYADLQHADLRHADLQGANLQGARLQGADLERADLTNVDLTVLDLRGVDFSKAVMMVGVGHPHITRSIEFPPEFKAAGLAILNHFEDVVRSKYSNIDVKVTITQEDKTVTMTIETDDGDQLEKIEKTLEEYGLVVRGEMAPAELLDDRMDTLRLEYRLEQAQSEVRMQEKMLALQQVSIVDLHRRLSEAIARPPAEAPTVHVSPVTYVAVDQNQHASLHVELTQLTDLQSSLSDLADRLPQDSPARAEAQEVAKELEDVAKDPEKAKTSAVPERVRRFFEDLGDEKSRLGKTVKGIGRGVEIAQEVGKRYNDVAQWVGWPQVPRPLLGKAKD
ncbi:MAG: hypothetical protein GY722_04585 [bacterium]|nr:hypothetical protein [bacterium]